MRCPQCGLEMVIWKASVQEGKREIIYACRNPRCPAFDARLKQKEK